MRCDCEWNDRDIYNELCPICWEELESRKEKFCKECLTDQWYEDVQDDLCWKCREKEKK